jgi:hypothetical protein
MALDVSDSDTSNMSNKPIVCAKAEEILNGVVNYDPTSVLDMFINVDPTRKKPRNLAVRKQTHSWILCPPLAYMKLNLGKLVTH